MAKYNKFNNVESSTGHTGFSAARNLLDANGLSDVEVKPLTFFKAMFYGNHYNAKTNTIYLRQGIINSKSIKYGSFWAVFLTASLSSGQVALKGFVHG